MRIMYLSLSIVLGGILFQVFDAFKNDLVMPLIKIVFGPLPYHLIFAGSIFLIGDFLENILATAIAIGLLGLLVFFPCKRVLLRANKQVMAL